MPIEFDDTRVDVSHVDDRRGGAGGLAIGGGVGVVGLVLYLIVQLLGGSASQLALPSAVPGEQQQESSTDLAQRCNSPGALEQYTDCRLIKTFDVADTVWRAEFDRRGLSYDTPRFGFFTGVTQTGCGQATAQVGPFYCPPDQEIYFDLGFLQQLQQQFGAQGEFAQAYIVAHEFGHHLQTLLGTERQVRAAQQADPARAHLYSIALELQADCYAGVWARLASQRTEGGIHLTSDNIAEAENAAQAVGDDRIQQKVQGRVDPESWTHGSSQQRKDWFDTGFRSGNLDDCTTFRALSAG